MYDRNNDGNIGNNEQIQKDIDNGSIGNTFKPENYSKLYPTSLNKQKYSINIPNEKKILNNITFNKIADDKKFHKKKCLIFNQKLMKIY